MSADSTISATGTTVRQRIPVVSLAFKVLRQTARYERNQRHSLNWLLATFPELLVRHDGRLTSVRETGALGFLQASVIEHRCNGDLVAATSPERIERLRAALHQGGLPGGLLARLRH